MKVEHRRSSILAPKREEGEDSDEEVGLNVEVEYFEGHGRAEPIRMMLSISGVEYPNKYIDNDEWLTLKQNKKLYPTGGLPVVSINGKRYFETMATLRSLAMGLGIYDTDDLVGCYTSDSIMDTFSEIMNKAGALGFAQNDTERE